MGDGRVRNRNPTTDPSTQNPIPIGETQAVVGLVGLLKWRKRARKTKKRRSTSYEAAASRAEYLRERGHTPESQRRGARGTRLLDAGAPRRALLPQAQYSRLPENGPVPPRV